MRKILLSMVLMLAIAAAAQAAPRMSIPETEFNFGYVPQNSSISHVFWLHSTGDDTLKIDRVVPG